MPIFVFIMVNDTPAITLDVRLEFVSDRRGCA